MGPLGNAANAAEHDYSIHNDDMLDPGDFYGPAATPEPTTHPPGSSEKMRVLIERFNDGQDLFHPQDAVLPDSMGFAPVPLGNGERVRGRLLTEEGPGQWTPSGDAPPPAAKPKQARTREQVERKRAREQTLAHRIRERDRKRRDYARRMGRTYFPRDPMGQLHLWSWEGMFEQWERMERQFEEQRQQQERRRLAS